MGAEIMNKFLKVIGIGNNNEDNYDDGYADDYENEGYTDEIDDEDMYSQQGGARSRARASVREVEEGNGNRPTKVISVNNGMSASKMVITQPTCYNDVEEVGT